MQAEAAAAAAPASTVPDPVDLRRLERCLPTAEGRFIDASGSLFEDSSGSVQRLLWEALRDATKWRLGESALPGRGATANGVVPPAANGALPLAAPLRTHSRRPWSVGHLFVLAAAGSGTGGSAVQQPAQPLV